jgi:hypothetical protein
MSEVALTRRDRTIGFVLLALGFAVTIVPDFRLAGQPIDPSYVGFAWMVAGVLLATSAWSARPNPVLNRRAAAGLFIFGLASPFLVNLINNSLGA